MKYCAAAAGALGLTTTDLVKLEKALATSSTDGGTQVVWLNGAACTGCTVSFANTAYLSSVQDLLVPWAKAAPAVAAAVGITTAQLVATIDGGVLTDTGANGPLDLVFIETLSSSVGHRAKLAAASARSTGGYVLCIEGAIQTASSGNYCRLGDGAAYNDTATIAFMDEVREFALDENCVAILAVGTCASFGGIPAAKGSVTGARGLISTGRISGGYKTTDTQGLWDYFKATDSGTISVASITATGGSGYTTVPIVSFSGGTTAPGFVPPEATAYISGGTIASIVVTNSGYGYLTAPTVSISAPPVGSLTITTTMTPAAGLAGADKYLTADQWQSLMAKTICISGCPPHPDWIVGTIVYLLASAPTFEPPLLDKYHRPFDYYGQYQCTNCIWQTNNPGKDNAIPPNDLKDIKNGDQSTWSKGHPTRGNSPRLYKYKYDSPFEGCIGILGCKGRKTKADCSYRRWNSDSLNDNGVSFCVQTRAGCHGCTEPRYPDGWGKFFSYR